MQFCMVKLYMQTLNAILLGEELHVLYNSISLRVGSKWNLKGQSICTIYSSYVHNMHKLFLRTLQRVLSDIDVNADGRAIGADQLET